jgi:hypothetical protein
MLKLPMPGMVNRVRQFVRTVLAMDSNWVACSPGRCSHLEPLNLVEAGNERLTGHVLDVNPAHANRGPKWAERFTLAPAKKSGNLSFRIPKKK